MGATHLVLLLLLYLVFNSVVIAISPHPGRRPTTPWERFLLLAGRLSFLRFGAREGDSPGTLHLPLTRQPPPDSTLRGEVQRLPRPPAVVALLLLPLLAGCLAQLDRARQDYTAAVKVAQAAQVRLKAYDARHQLDLVRQAGPGHGPQAQQALAAYRARRSGVVEQARRTEEVLDAAADVLLLGEGPAPARAAADARASALALRASVDTLIAEGGR